MRRILLLVFAAAGVLALAGCADFSADRESMQHYSEAKHDTLLSQSSVPGAQTVGRALAVAGKEAKHADQVDQTSESGQ